MARTRRYRSSSVSSSSSSRSRHRRTQKLDRYGMIRRYSSKRSVDDYASQHQRIPKNHYKVKHMPSTSRRRSSSCDFEDFRRKYSPLKGRYRSPRRYYARRSRSRSRSSDSDYHRHQKYRASKSYKRSRRSSLSPSLRKRRISSSPSSGDSRHCRHRSSVTKKRRLEEVINHSGREREVNHSGREKEVSHSGREREVNHSGRESLLAKRLKKKFCRSKSDKSTLHRLYEESGRYLEERRLKKALKCINLAAGLCKDDNEFLSKIYSRRGTIYFQQEKPRCSFQGFVDCERAFMLNKDNIEARKGMSKALFQGANKWYRMKSYEEALGLCNQALDLNDSNGEAFVLQQLLKKKLLEKKARDENVRKVPFASTPRVKVVPEKITNNESALCSKQEKITLDEVKHLYEKIKNELLKENYPRALIYIKQALRLYSDDISDDSMFRELFILKQNIMKMNSSL